MGLLDDLEQEAQRRKASLDEVERAKAEREAVFKTQLEPAMQALHEYLSKLTANLTFLKTKSRIKFEIPGYGPIVAAIDHDYDLKANKLSPTSKEIVLGFHATVVSEECPTAEVHGSAKIRTLNMLFQKYRLAALHEFKKDDAGEMTSATFKARGRIPLNATVATDAETTIVRMSFTNFDTLGTVTKNVSPAHFNEQLFDEMGRFVAREPSQLFREELPDDYRKQLQQRVQQDQMRRRWESKIAEQQKEELERLKREQSLKGKLEGTLAAAREKAPSLIDKVRGLFKKP